jgi:WD40 repeat protein
MIELWDPETFDLPESLDFNLVTDTDLLEIAKSKTFALSCAASNTGELIAFYTRDRKIRVFSIKSGKLLRTIDDSLQ